MQRQQCAITIQQHYKLMPSRPRKVAGMTINSMAVAMLCALAVGPRAHAAAALVAARVGQLRTRGLTVNTARRMTLYYCARQQYIRVGDTPKVQNLILIRVVLWDV